MITAHKRDHLFVYSDGLFEVVNTDGRIFGRDQLLEFLSDISCLPRNEIVDQVIHHVMHFAGDESIQDDIAVLSAELL